MQKRIVVVSMLVALFLASGGATGLVSMESRSAENHALAALEFSDIANLAGPVCFPGDPCGPQRPSGSGLAGPVCYPGDPCGPQGTSVGTTPSIERTTGA